MVIVWDEPKRIANLDKHGFDFADSVEFDWENALIEPAKADTLGKSRIRAIGHFRDGIAVVIFGLLGTEGISIISFRIANERERNRFYGQR